MADVAVKRQVKDLPQEALDYFENDELRARCFIEKYALWDLEDQLKETHPRQMWERVARAMASVEDHETEWLQEFMWLLSDFRFVPGGRILHGAGSPRKVTQTNCYFTSVEEDSLEAIFEWCKKAARTYSFGGGNGVDIGILRPQGTPVHNAARTSSGAVSFMELFSTTTGTIGQHGRRGALMITCPVDHPDIQAFIHVKGKDLRSVRYANVSVKVTDEFMQAVEEGKPFTLRFENEWTGRVESEVDARELWDDLIQSAHASAEPGIIFWDNVKRESPSEYCAPVEGTNPSLVAGTQVLTRNGILPIDELEGRGTKVPVPSGGTAYAECVRTGDSEPIYRIELQGGHEYFATAQHEWPVWWTGKGLHRKIPTKYLRPGDRIPFERRTELGYGTDGTYDEGFLAGVILGDGNITKRSDDGRIQVGFVFGEKDEAIKERVLDILESITGFRYNPTRRKREGRPWYEIHASSPFLVALMESWGLKSKEDGLPTTVWTQASEDFRRGLVDGLFSTDGFVTDSKSLQQRAVLVSSRKKLVDDLSKLLGFYGIKNYIRYAKSKASFPNGKDYGREYERWDLRISHGAALHFRSIFRLSHPDKQARLEKLRDLKREVPTADTCVVRNVELTSRREPVWDLRVDHREHAFSLAHVTTGNCGEQPLEHNGACTLGHVNLSASIRDGFTKQAEVDWAGLERAVRLGVRFLDDVVEVNLPLHAHKEQTEQARLTRRIGLGVTGLGDMLAKLRIQYDSDEAITFVDGLMERIRNWAYDASADLAQEKGPFPLFQAEPHLERPFVQRLPEDLRDKIRKQGLRNVCILTVAPVGSGSVLTGTSSGVEPIFSLEYLRRSESLSKEWYEVEHPLVREYRKATGDQGDDLPDFFVTSHQIDPFFRVKMQGTLQRYIDSAISSTVNLAEDTSVETVKEIYEYAWKQGCKGVTVYREGSREGILLTSREKSAQGEVGATETVAVHKEVGKPRARPSVVRGTTQKIETGYGKLYVTINEDEEGLFEVFAQIGRGGGYTASFTEAVARLISLSLRSGIPADEVIDQLEGIRSPRLAWDHQEKIYSVPDALSKALKRHLSGYDQTTLQPQVESFGPVLDEELDKESRDGRETREGDEAMVRKGLSPECPECGSPLIFEENCIKCQHCGFSEC